MRSTSKRWARLGPFWLLSSTVDSVPVLLLCLMLQLPLVGGQWQAGLPSLAWLILTGVLAQNLAWRYGKTRHVPAVAEVTFGFLLASGSYLLSYRSWTLAGHGGALLAWGPPWLAGLASLAVWLLQLLRTDRSTAAALRRHERYAYLAGALLLMAWMTGLLRQPGATLELSSLLVIGFVAALLELGLGTQQENAERLASTGERQAYGISWSLPISVAVGGLAIGLAEVLPMGALSWLGGLFSFIGRLLYYPIMAFARLLFYLLGPLIHKLYSRDAQDLLQNLQEHSQKAQDRPGWIGHGQVVTLSPMIRLALVLFVIAVVIALVVFLRRREGGAEEGDEERQNLGTLAHLRRDLGRKFSRKASGPAIPPATHEMQRLYRRLQRWAASRGMQRQPGQTPAAHAAALGARLPQVTPAVGQVVAAYEQFRYAPVPPAPADVAGAAQAVTRIEAQRTES